ncbi:MAG: response regulator [Spirochaetaceae bacterium]|nr:response regulator [Spirochaetaceae bacterium]MCF7947152.1 response regulator [Spirochaetia bacterium]MCF7950017.1 response regulator [Spirochaetaceae bacterium]
MENNGGDKVLFVDDEREILRALKRRFRKETFSLYTAGGGEEALEFLKNNNVQVIISDARMAGMNGIELLSEVKGIKPDITRIIFSGYVETEELMDAINKAEVFRFIAKPWDEEELLRFIFEGIEHYYSKRSTDK